jgi:hypothetical protein
MMNSQQFYNEMRRIEDRSVWRDGSKCGFDIGMKMVYETKRNWRRQTARTARAFTTIGKISH